MKVKDITKIGSHFFKKINAEQGSNPLMQPGRVLQATEPQIKNGGLKMLSKELGGHQMEQLLFILVANLPFLAVAAYWKRYNNNISCVGYWATE